jgi:hypothetical protein
MLPIQVLAKIEAYVFPSMSGLTSCFVFLKFLAHESVQIENLDEMSGLAHLGWIDSVKKMLYTTFGQFYGILFAHLEHMI